MLRHLLLRFLRNKGEGDKREGPSDIITAAISILIAIVVGVLMLPVILEALK